MALFHYFLWLSKVSLYLCTTPSLSITSISGHFGCFRILAIMNSAAVNIGVHVSFWITVLSGCGIAGSYGNSSFSFLRNLHTVFHSGCGILSCKLFSTVYKDFLFSTSLPTFFIYRLLDDTILTGVRWYLIVVFISISLMIHNAEILFMCLMAIFLWRNVYSDLLPIFWLVSLFESFFTIELYRLLMYFGH